MAAAGATTAVNNGYAQQHLQNKVNIYDLMNRNILSGHGDTIDSSISMNYKTTLRKEVISVLRGQAMLGLLGGSGFSQGGLQGGG